MNNIKSMHYNIRMLNVDIMNHTISFMRLCDKCNRYNILKKHTENRFCTICRKYCCIECNMVRDYTIYEITGLYCIECHSAHF